MADRMFDGPVDFETAANLTAQAPALYEWDTFAEKNEVSGWAGFQGRFQLCVFLVCALGPLVLSRAAAVGGGSYAGAQRIDSC